MRKNEKKGLPHIFHWSCKKVFCIGKYSVKQFLRLVNEKISFFLKKKGVVIIAFKEKRMNANLTQKEVADCLGINQATVHLWETGETRPRAALLPKIAKLYNCTIDELLKEE